MADYTYTKITGRFGSVIGDTPGDPDDLPDFVPPTSGDGTIRCSTKMVRNRQTRTILYPAEVKVVLDANGNLSHQGRPYVHLLAPNSSMDPDQFQYTIIMNLKFEGSRVETWGPYHFSPSEAEQDLFDMLLAGAAPGNNPTPKPPTIYDLAVRNGLFTGTEAEFVALYMSGNAPSEIYDLVNDTENPGFFAKTASSDVNPDPSNAGYFVETSQTDLVEDPNNAGFFTMS